MINKIFKILLVLGISGCANNLPINPFQLVEGSGSVLKNAELEGLMVSASFKYLNCTELKHGSMMIQNAIYEVPSGPAFLSVHARWARTIFGPIYYANANFELTLKEGQTYTISGLRTGKSLSLSVIDGTGKAVTDRKEVEFILGEGPLAMPHIPEYTAKRCVEELGSD